MKRARSARKRIMAIAMPALAPDERPSDDEESEESEESAEDVEEAEAGIAVLSAESPAGVPV